MITLPHDRLLYHSTGIQALSTDQSQCIPIQDLVCSSVGWLSMVDLNAAYSRQLLADPCSARDPTVRTVALVGLEPAFLTTVHE
jgi:hypothetical protein